MLQENSRGSRSSIKNNPHFHFPHPADGTIALTAKGESLLDTPPRDFAQHGAVFCINQSVLHVPREHVTAFSFMEPKQEWSPPPWPDGIPLLQFNDTAAHAIKVGDLPKYSSVIVLAQILHFYPDQKIHLYGFDYEEAPAVFTGVPFLSKRVTRELPALAEIWLPEKHRVTNHGKLTTERLEQCR